MKVECVAIRIAGQYNKQFDFIAVKKSVHILWEEAGCY